MVVDVPKSLKEAIVKVMKEMPVGTKFHGLDLQNMVARIYPAASTKYPDTILRVARMYCRDMFKVAKRSISLYERI